jgi:tetratricopeptide (TPR) repeat protein/tRNA A-37 threonylcarbamoyl transferase component Bud32
VIGQTVSHYRITSELGGGGEGRVYAADDVRLRRRVALKFPKAEGADDQYRARFLREARAASALNHPHIATVYDFGETETGQPFIVMEFVSGRSLRELLRAGPLPSARSVAICETVADALGEAHRHGIVHRDVKPGNLMVREDGVVKVLDFGVARMEARPDDTASVRTQEGNVRGTPHYMSPEQARGAPVDARSDLFSLGAVLYECLAGRPPFAGSNPIEVQAHVVQTDPPPPSRFCPGLPAELDRITLKALKKDCRKRYQSAAEMRADLGAARARLEADGDRRTEPLARPRLPPRQRIAAILAASLCVFAAAAGWRFWRERAHEASQEALRYYREGTDALRDGTYYKATKALERAVGIDDAMPLAHARLAEAWFELDNAAKAKDELLRALGEGSGYARLPQSDQLLIEGIRLTVTGNNGGAVEKYRQAVRAAPEQDKASAYMDLGRACDRSDKIKEALETYAEAGRRQPQYIAPILWQGILYGRQQERAKATEFFDKAELRYRGLSNLEGVAEVLYQRGVVANRFGDLDQARGLEQQALGTARTVGNPQQQIVALLQLANISCKQGKPEEAQGLADRALDLARGDSLENLTTRGLIELGVIFQNKGHPKEAKRCYAQALDYARRYKSARNQARALFLLASASSDLREFDEATPKLEEALAFFRQGGYLKETSQGLILLARVRRDKGDYNGALQAALEQVQLSRQGDQELLASAHIAAGMALYYWERFSQALAHFREAREVTSKTGNLTQAGPAVGNCVAMLWRLGRYGEAQSMLQEAGSLGQAAFVKLERAEMELSQLHAAQTRAILREISAAEKNDDEELAIESKWVSGLEAALSGRAAEGKRLAAEAVSGAEALCYPLLVAQAKLSLAEVLLASGDPADASRLALEVQPQFGRAAQYESEWRSWSVAARAAQARGDTAQARDWAGRAAAQLTRFQQRLEAADAASYLKRPDIHRRRAEVERLMKEAISRRKQANGTKM